MEKNLETEIIEALKSGKEEAFRYIYKTYYTDDIFPHNVSF